KPPVLTRALPRVAFGDVERDAVASAPKLVGQGALLVVGEPARHPHTLDGEPLCMLPRLECLVMSHGKKVEGNEEGTASESCMPCLSYASHLTSTQRLGDSSVSRDVSASRPRRRAPTVPAPSDSASSPS